MDKTLRDKLLNSFPNTVCMGIVKEYDTGRSGASVFAVDFQSPDESELNGIYIVKIDRSTLAGNEKKLYTSPNIVPLTSFLAPYRKISQVVEKWQAIAYDVAFNELTRTRTLTSLLDEGGESSYEAQRQIKQLANALVNWNIAQFSNKRKVLDPYAILCLMLGMRKKDMPQRFNTYLPSWDQKTLHIRVNGLDRVLPNPLAYLYKETWNRVHENFPCPIGHIHGDLHTGNIICLPGNNEVPKVIDFGQYHPDRVPFFDLAYLEFDIIQHLLPVENIHYRQQWLNLLEFSMAKILPYGHPSGDQADRAWMLIRSIREQVERLQQMNQRLQSTYEIVWWIATVAVGLNFANKGDESRSASERISALLYAAYGLEHLFRILDVKIPSEEKPPLIAWIQDKTPQTYSQSPAKSQLREDWEEIPHLQAFYGRKDERDTLRQWIVDDHCRITAILGIGGVGKTALAARVVEEIKDKFEQVFWRSLKNAPLPVDVFLQSCIQFLSNQEQTSLSENVDDKISLLLEYLRNHRCLLVLDNIETILQGGNNARQYREGYEGYGLLIRNIGEMKHQSCLLLTSREKPEEIVRLQSRGSTQLIHSLSLRGVGITDGRRILKSKGVTSGSKKEFVELINFYSGNPLELELVSEPIRELFNGDISDFLKRKTSRVSLVHDLLDEQFQRLSSLEQEIIYWLAIEREAISFEDLEVDVVHPLENGESLIEALKSLNRRSLIEISNSRCTLQPVIMEYVTDRFIEQVSTEIDLGAVSLFASHALIKAQAKDYIRESQVRFILTPVKERLLMNMGKAGIENKIKHILATLHRTRLHTSDYAAGNALNLLIQLRIDLRGYDFSEFAVRQAYLLDTVLPEVNFAHSNLATSVFTEIFGSILSVTFSSSGQLLAAGTASGEVQLWQIPGGTPLLTCQGHTDWVRSVAFSTDSSTIVSGSDDKTVRLWEVGSGRCLKTLQGHTDLVRSVAFDPSGCIVASGSEDKTVRLWEVSSGRCLKTLQGHTDRVMSVAFSSDGNTIASGGDDTFIRLWEVGSGECFKILQGHTDQIHTIAVSPDGSTIASSGDDKTIRLWEVSSGQCCKVLQGHTDLVYSVAFSLDGRIVASGSDDKTVRLWEVSSGRCLKILQGHTGLIRSVAYSPDGRTIASGSDDKTVRLWEAHSGYCVKTLHGHSSWEYSVAFSPDGSTLVSGSEDQSVRLWEISSGQCLQTLREHTQRVWSVAFSPDGNTVASGSDDQTVRLWEVNSGQCLKVLQGHDSWIWSVAFSPDGNIVASGGGDKIVCLWEVNSGQCLRTLQEQTNLIWSLAFGPDGRIIATGSNDGTIRLWEVQTGVCVKMLQGHNSWVRSVAFSPDGSTIVSGSDDKTVRLWEVNSGQCLKILHGHTNLVYSVAFSSDSRTVASGSHDQTVCLWEVNSGQCLKVLRGHNNWIWSVAFSPDSSIVASSSSDGTIKLWDILTGKCLKTLRSERPYENLNIFDVRGLTEAQKATLKILGAIEEER